MAVMGSCEISNNNANEVMDALMSGKVVSKTMRRKKLSFVAKNRKWILLLGFFLVFVTAGSVAFGIFKASSGKPDIRRRCIDDLRILNGKLTNATGSYHGDTAEVECHGGHQVNGSDIVTCLASGHWNETPICLPIPCTKLYLPTNAKVDLRHLTHRINEVDIACDHGYRLEGHAEVFCHNNGSWSEIPTCKPVGCGLPSHINKGIILNLTDTTYNNTFSVKCNRGYILNGKDIIKCESDGKWDDLPECKPVSCGTPTIPDHAHIKEIEGVTFKQSLSYRCENDYVLVGSNVSKCKSNGKWSALPACKTQCLESMNVSNGNVTKMNNLHTRDMWLDGDIALIKCLFGYKVNGSNTTKCLPSGQWSEHPSCIRKQCAMFETPENAGISSDKQLVYYVNDEVTLSCVKGFRLNGSAIVKCQENEAWSKIPMCAPISCNGPKLERNVLIHNFTGVHYGDTFHVTCGHGFNLIGDKIVRCGLDGNWIGRPKCEPVSCGIATAPANAYVLYVNCTVFGCKTSFGCNHGYTLIGDGKATCQMDGQWYSHYACVKNKVVTTPPRDRNNKHEGNGNHGNHHDVGPRPHPIPPRHNNNNNHGQSGCSGIHGDVGIRTMAALLVVAIVNRVFSM